MNYLFVRDLTTNEALPPPQKTDATASKLPVTRKRSRRKLATAGRQCHCLQITCNSEAQQTGTLPYGDTLATTRLLHSRTFSPQVGSSHWQLGCCPCCASESLKSFRAAVLNSKVRCNDDPKCNCHAGPLFSNWKLNCFFESSIFHHDKNLYPRPNR